MGYYKTVKKWVPAHYRRVNGRRVYVRGHYTTVKIYVPTKRRR
jgi:hypothetical protein